MKTEGFKNGKLRFCRRTSC